MAWPYTSYATFVDNAPPACDAAFLNAVQSAVNGLYSGTQALGGTFGGTVAPTPAFTKSVLSKEAVPVAMCQFTPGLTTTFRWGYNIASVTRSGIGIYDVNLGTALTSIASAMAFISWTVTAFASAFTWSCVFNSTSQIEVRTEYANALSDGSGGTDAMLVVYGT